VASVSTGVSATAAQYAGITQWIEGYNCTDLAWGTASAKTVTLSFWVRSSLTGTYCIQIANFDGSRSYIATYAVTAANTWEKKTITLTGATTGTWYSDNQRGMTIWFDLGSGSNWATATPNTWLNVSKTCTSAQTNVIGTTGATFYLTGVQLEAGSVATPFEVRPMQAELMMCQRYYLAYKAFSNQTRVPYAVGNTATGSTTYMGFIFPVPMRVTPTAVTVTNLAGNHFGSHGATSYTSFTGGNTESMIVTLNYTGSAYAVTLLTNDTDTGFIGFSAEL
jgi:hypothetical protein